MCIAVKCSWFLCIVLLFCVYLCYLKCIVSLCVCIAVSHTLDAGLLARSQYPEGLATGQLGTGFFLVSLCLKANAEMVPKTPSCYCILLI